MAADIWQSGAGYEGYVGRWSRRVAEAFIERLEVPAGSRWVAVGCGTGAIPETILTVADPASVVGVDPSEAFVAFAQSKVTDARASFALGDGAALPLPDAGADAAVSGLVLNFVPDPVAMLAEMARVTRPDGTVAVYVWDYADGMEMMRHFWDAAVELNPVAHLVELILSAKPHPEQGFRACLGILRLVRSYGANRVEAACQRGIDIGARTYGSVVSILRNNLDRAYRPQSVPDVPPVQHGNIRGGGYYH